MDNASAFSSNKIEMEMSPIQAQNLEKVEFKIPEVGQAPAVKAPTPATVYDSASLAGSNLRDQFKTPDVAPQGDIKYGVNALTDNLKEAVTGLFGALQSKDPDIQGPQPGMDPQQQMAAAPVARPPAFSL